uniref:Uncharacterized protein AlNc14C4G587 n=1 Tax=Albugo laibachii Nc14 TaxID=890382 RepID=F0W0E4_9STRA|nr:conserved hypothetical protein [Albugo laibachii Nc14]|eukprot:CCA14516.1 conserved hypothetical protein [Albugo laibachii Nc14]
MTQVERLLSWKSDEGKKLVPWKIVANANQTAFCIKLRVLGGTPAKGNIYRGNKSHYVTLSLHTDAKMEAVKYGSVFEAIEVAFVTMKSDDKEKKAESSCLLVLDVAGKSLRIHNDHHDSTHSITLPKEIQRFFVTPLRSDSSDSSKLYHRLVCTAIDDSSNTEMIFFEDELVKMSQDSYPHRHWRSETAERVINVSWNKPELTGGSHGDDGSVSMAAVLTTDRIVILSEHLTPLARYSTHSQIQSSLWIAQSLIVATREGHLRYLTPIFSTHTKQNDKEEMHLILSFAPGDMTAENGSENMCVQLVAAIGDRLIYTLTDPHTLVNHVVIRPWCLAEPIAAGYLSSNSYIKAIVEREILSFISDSTTDVVNPLTDKLLFVLFERFRWDQNLHILLRHFSNLENFTGGAEKNSQELSYKSADATTKATAFGKSSRVYNRAMASTLSGFFDWRATVEQSIRHDPGLIDYAFKMDLEDSNSSFFAKLPAKSSSVACLYNAFGDFFVSIGCLELAVKCYDLTGNDQALLTLMIKLGGFQRLDKSCNGKGGSIKMLSGVLRSEWARLYSKLSCISLLDALAKNNTTIPRLDSGHWRRHDCFSLLCCEQIFSNQERRTRLLPLSQASSFIMLHHKSEYETPALNSARSELTANVLPWRRLSPGDCRDWIGKALGSASTSDRNEDGTEVCNTLRLADDEPRNPRYEVLMQYQKDRETADNGETETSLQSSEAEYGAAASQDAVPQFVKASIGPFLDDEDAVVAYWRFEEGNSILARMQNENEKQEMKIYDLDSLDISKHENHLTILSFGGLYDPDPGAQTALNCMTFAPSSSPVDKGEPGRVQEPFVLQFPSSNQYRDVYGAKCHVSSGSSLDLGLVFDEDPYRRKLTVECWIRNFCLAKESQLSARNDDGDDSMGTSEISPAPEMGDTLLRRLIGRSSNEGSVWWELYLDKAFLCLRYADQVLHSELTVTHASTWQHLAFTIDIASYGHALGKVYIQGQLAGVKDFKSFDEMHQANLSDPESLNEKRKSFLWMGNSLENYEMTEIRIWATARSPEQLQDMKENYLGIAETKKKLKVAIHKRNCLCDKCIGYRKRKTGAIVTPENFRSPIKSGNSTLTEGKGYTNTGFCFPSTPPASKSRERRWPQPTHSNATM